MGGIAGIIGNPFDNLGTVSTSSVGANNSSVLTLVINPTFFQVGTYYLGAAFSAGTGFIDSHSNIGTVTIGPVTPIATTTTLSTSNPTALYGTAVTLTATVIPSSGTAAPSGSVTFQENQGSIILGTLGTVSTSSVGANNSSVFTFVIPPTFLQVGVYQIDAAFTAGTGFSSSGGPFGNSNVTETVPAAPTTTTFAVSAPTTTTAGGAFLVTVTAQDGNGHTATGYSGTVHITSSGGAPILPADATLTNGAGSFLVTLTSMGTYTIKAQDTANAAITGSSGNIVLSPGAASYFTVAVPASATSGSPISASVTALDPFGNTATTYSGKVHLTSSDASAMLPPDAILTNGVGTFTVTLNTGGSQTVTASDVSSLTTPPLITGTSAAITTRGLVVTAFTPNDSGFSATFSKPFNPADLTLYGSNLSTVQDVTLVGKTSGPITGTLILNSTDTGITFIASENSLQAFFGTTILPDDTYTATLVSGSGSNGFLDALNTGLDGLNNGGHANYTNTFTIANATKPTLSIPDFARGPDGTHTIKVPNNTAGGIPITLANATNVKNVTFILNFNPALFTPTAGSTVDSTAAATATFTMTAVDASDVMFTYTNSAPQSGTVVLGDIVATVPNSAASLYKSKELLSLNSITVNGAAFTGVWANGVHVNAYSGDVTGNGSIDGLDVATASNVAQGKATGFASYTLLDPAVIGDVGADISVDAGDVSDLASFVSRLPMPPIPAIPTGLTIVAAGPDPTLSLGEPGGVSPRSLAPAGGIVNVSVLLDHPHPEGSTGMTEAILALTYDPKALSVSSSDITLGSIPGLGAGWQLNSVIDQATGQIGIELFSTTAITATQAGSLVNIAFHVQAGEPGGVSPRSIVQLVSSLMAGGQQFTTQVDDAQGQYILSPGMDRLVVPTGLGPLATIPPVSGQRLVSRPPTSRR